MHILKAEAFANKAGIVLDTFCFADLFGTLELNPQEVDRLKETIVDSLAGKISLQALMSGSVNPPASSRPKLKVPTQIRFDDTSSSRSTLLELSTQDRLGLLYQVSSTLAELECNIEVALIDTEGQKMIDVSYLTRSEEKLNPFEQQAIREGLLRQL